MSRLARLTFTVWMLGLLFLVPTVVQAQAPTATPSPNPASDTATPRATTNIGFAAASVTATLTATATATSVAAATTLLPTPTPVGELEVSLDTAQEGPLVGTILNNLSVHTARFFLEGTTYLLPPGTARGIQLPRQTSVLNLYNCAAETAESQTCFWDPYLVQSEGLYDIYASPAQADVARLLLRESGTPPGDQVWVQNRTSHAESVVFRGEAVELPATALYEFPVTGGAPAILYVRHCLSLDGQSVCEWTPKTLEAGTFYAMVDNIVRGSTEGSMITTLELRPVVGGVITESAAGSQVAPSTSTVAVNGQVRCHLEVPVLNVRSGPGLRYLIIDKIRSDGPTPTSVIVTGRSVDGQWLTVDASVTPDGWITSGAGFVTCDANLSDLPFVEAPPLPDPIPGPVAVATVSPNDTNVAPEAPAVEVTPEPVDNAEDAPSAPAPLIGAPAGLGLLQVNNGFSHEIRVTIDQRYRPDQGPSEFDLQPGTVTNIVVFPGTISFTASSAWSNLSHNTTLDIEPDAIIPLWLRFERDSGGSWYLAWN